MKKVLHRTTKDGENLTITISNDGHNPKDRYWSITGEIKAQGSRVISCCGCFHEEILAADPSLKPFVKLHLSTLDGIPMHAIANAQYYAWEHYRACNGLDTDTASYNRQSPEKWLRVLFNHLRLTEEQERMLTDELVLASAPTSDSLADVKEEINARVCAFIVDNNLDKQWKASAREAIHLLDSLEDEPEPKLPDVGLEFKYELKHTNPDGFKTYDITLKKGRRSMTVEFGCGPALGDPDLDSVMECLCSDARSVMDDPDIEEWMKDFGMDFDLKALKAFKGCKKELKDLKRLLGNDFERVLNMY